MKCDCCHEAEARANSLKCSYCYRWCEPGRCNREKDHEQPERRAYERIAFYDRDRCEQDYEDELRERDERNV